MLYSDVTEALYYNCEMCGPLVRGSGPMAGKYVYKVKYKKKNSFPSHNWKINRMHVCVNKAACICLNCNVHDPSGRGSGLPVGSKWPYIVK